MNTYAVGYPDIGDYVNKITNRFANPYIDDERFQLSYDQNDLPAVRQSDIRLLIGAAVAGEVRAAVKKETGYECSAGIAHNKILAKLAAGLNKPNKQTILPLGEIPGFFDSLPVGKIKGLGGKFGEVVCETLGIKFLGQLCKFSEGELQRKYDEKNGWVYPHFPIPIIKTLNFGLFRGSTWLFNIARGIDLEAVTPRFYSKSIGCCKKFPGRNNITGLKSLQHWLGELSSEINERLEKDFIENNRKAKQMVVQYIQDIDGQEVASSRSTSLKDYDKESLAKFALELIRSNTKTFLRAESDSALNNAIKFLGISAGKFETVSNAQNKLQEMFANQAAKKRRVSGEEAVQPPKAQPETKPKQTEESKMQSFFANYLQGAKKEEKKPTSDEAENIPPEDAPKKSFFDEYKQKLKAVTQAESGTPVTSTPPELKGSFFAKYLEQQREEKTQESEGDAEDSTELQGLAEELDAIEANNSKDFDEDTIEEPVSTLEGDIYVPEKEVLVEATTSKSNETSETPTLNVSEERQSVAEQPLTEEELKPSTSKRKFDQLDYKETYAEFAIPEVRSDLLPMVKCDQCGAQIPDDVKYLQTHRDHHFAQELSRQLKSEQREERQQCRQKEAPKPTPPKKQKKGAGSGNTTVSQTNSIAKFFSAKPTTKPPPSDVPMEQCSECKAYIKSVDMPEHLDYHVARNLQRELNQQDLRSRTAALEKEKSSPGQSKKQKQLNNTIGGPSRGNKTIAQFFSQTN